jgi:hypothetical protein
MQQLSGGEELRAKGVSSAVVVVIVVAIVVAASISAYLLTCGEEVGPGGIQVYPEATKSNMTFEDMAQILAGPQAGPEQLAKVWHGLGMVGLPLPAGWSSQVYSFQVGFQTGEAAEDVVSWYKSQMSEWTIHMDNTISGFPCPIHTLGYTRGDDAAMIMVMGDHTDILIALAFGPKEGLAE